MPPFDGLRVSGTDKATAILSACAELVEAHPEEFFSILLGMGIPWWLARWMGYASVGIIAVFGLLMISGNYMLLSQWAFKLLPGAATSTGLP